MELRLLDNLIKNGKIISKRAEADLYLVYFEGRESILKIRKVKKYRIKEIDLSIRRNRTYLEANILNFLSENNFPSPKLYYANLSETYLIMEYIKGGKLKNLLDRHVIDDIEGIGLRIGELVGRLHNLGIIHNDLTTSNFILRENSIDQIYLIDYGLSMKSDSFKDKAVDIDVFHRVLISTHPNESNIIFRNFLEGYKTVSSDYSDTIKFYNKLSKMGRYHERR
jgi:Kae1-associated kinase Bud32